MIYLGIDVSKFKHNCFLADEDNFDKGCHFEIKNSKDGFEYLIKKLSWLIVKSYYFWLKICFSCFPTYP